MADIDVVKKESGSKLWLWILMVAVIAFVLWLVMAGSQPEQVGSWLNDAASSIGLAQASIAQGALV